MPRNQQQLIHLLTLYNSNILCILFWGACHLVHLWLFVIPAAGHSHDLWERELEKDLLLFIHKVNAGPVHRYDNVILGQARPCEQMWSHPLKNIHNH